MGCLEVDGAGGFVIGMDSRSVTASNSGCSNIILN